MSSVTNHASPVCIEDSVFSIERALQAGCYLNSPLKIFGPKDRMTYGNIDIVLKAVASFEADKTRYTTFNMKFVNTGRDKDHAQRVSKAFEKSQESLKDTYAKTGLQATFNF